MIRCAFLQCLLFPLWLFGREAVAQTPSWSPEFATAGIGGRVFASETYNNELYAGGWRFAAKGGVIRGLARYDGRAWHAVSSGIDLIGYTNPFTDPQIRAMAIYGGELVFAGTFDRAGGQVINQIAAWNGSTIRPLGSGLQLSFGDADVRGLAVFNNELYAAGQFDRAGGLPVNGIARWDGTTWRAVGTGLRMNGGASVGYARALQTHNGALYVGGEFDAAGAVAAHNVAMWNGTSWSTLAGGAQFPVYALASYGTELVAAGQFQIGSNVAMLAAWNGGAWHALGQGGPDLPVLALCAIGSHLYAGGQFYFPGPYLARFDGTSWTNIGGIAGIFSGTTGTSVYALHQHGTELIVGGEFTTADVAPGAVGAVRSANIASFDGTTHWRGLGEGLGADRPIQKLLEWRGKVIAIGGFTEIGAVRAIGLAAFDGDRWTTMGAFDGGVWAATIHQGDLVVSGVFTSIDGRPFAGIARHDGTQWLPLGTLAPPGLHAHGNDLFGFGGGAGLQRWNGSSFVTVALPNTVISHLHTHTDGLLYATMDSAFTHAVYVWNGSQLQQIGTPNDFVQTLGSYGSELLVGGRFTAVSGTAANLIARWNGTTWRAMPAPVSGYSAEAFCEMDGALYAGVNGDPRGFWLKLNGSTWQALGSGIDGVPQTFFVDRATSALLGSGTFLTAGGLPSLNLAAWRTQPAWVNRLHGTQGAAGQPLLRGAGSMQSGTTATWTVEGPASLPVAFVLGFTRVDQPLFGGILVPALDVVAGLTTGTNGSVSFGLAVPPGLSVGIPLFTQAWLLDPSGPSGLTTSNALECSTR